MISANAPTADVLIIGGGQAGTQVAIELADHGFGGSMRILSSEDVLPYERPPLSKGFLAGDVTADELSLRPASYWTKAGVDVELNQTVVDVDADRHVVMTADGQHFGYRTLVWAAGGSPRALVAPGAELDGVHQLRTMADAERLRSAATEARRVVVVGGGFIGLEVAATFRKQGLDVTIVEYQDRLLARVTCPIVSDYFAELHRGHGAKLRLGVGVNGLRGQHGQIEGVELSDGQLLAADLVVVGIGLVPNVEPLRAAGARCSNGVDVDAAGRTSLPDILAVGDCANAVNAYAGDIPVRLESVQNAGEHARVVAATIMGRERPTPSVPWFWSNQYDVKFKTMGVQADHDTVVLRGDPVTGRFSVVYLRKGVVIAVDAINHLRDYAQAKALVETQMPVDIDLLRDATIPLKSLIAAHAEHVA